MTALARATVCALAASLSILGGCSRDEPTASSAAAPTVTATPTPSTPPAAQAPDDSNHVGVAGTSWRLVQIMSMDDTTHTPDDPALYTLEFGDDGSMRVRADCNLGTGSYTSNPEGQLQFGVIAATQAECPPGSLHDQYMTQFQWVRSYTMKDGHLFLATMADGSIVEFEPAPASIP